MLRKYSDILFRQLSTQTVFLVLSIIVLIVALGLIEKGTHLFSKASSVATISIEPTNQTLPPEGTFSLYLNVLGEQLSFVHTEVIFDPNRVQLSSAPQLTNTKLTSVVVLTPFTDANKTDGTGGRLTIVLALDPQFKSDPPTGTFEFARLKFNPVTTLPNQTTTLAIDNNTAQLVNMSANLISYTIVNSTLTLNPASSTPGPSPLPTPASDTIAPSVTITNPANGATIDRNTTVIITATAQDNVGVTKVEFSVSSSLKCTNTTSPYSCSWKVPGKPNSTYSITVRAYDTAGNSGEQTITVNSTK